MQINEIFSSIDGEGIRTGYLTTFIRSFGCNLSCSYCDTVYACVVDENEQQQFTTMTPQEIVARCKDSWYNEGKIAGMAEGLSDDEKYQQGWHDAIEKQGEQNHAWSKEDERMMLSIEQVMNCASLLNIVPQKIDKVRTWLKSIKERIE